MFFETVVGFEFNIKKIIKKFRPHPLLLWIPMTDLNILRTTQSGWWHWIVLSWFFTSCNCNVPPIRELLFFWRWKNGTWPTRCFWSSRHIFHKALPRNTWDNSREVTSHTSPLLFSGAPRRGVCRRMFPLPRAQEHKWSIVPRLR